MSMILEEVAYRMFLRNVADYAEPALAELAWMDPDIRGFWVQQAESVAADLADRPRAATDVDLDVGNTEAAGLRERIR
jgi:hypothetical protein